MSGYRGYSMSNNAYNAYENGLKPISKWSKSEIINEIKENYEDQELTFSFDIFKKLTLSKLRKFLYCSEWHHTAKFYNETNFYSINYDKLLELSDEKLFKILEEKEIKEKDEEIPYIAEVKYLEWSGTRNHPKVTEVINTAKIIGNWAFLKNGKKKLITGNGFEILKKVGVWFEYN